MLNFWHFGMTLLYFNHNYGPNYASNGSGMPNYVMLDTKNFKITPQSPKIEP